MEVDPTTLPPVKCPRHNHYMVFAGFVRRHGRLYAVYQCPKKKKLRRYVLIEKVHDIKRNP